LPGWPDVLLPRQSQPGKPQSFAKRHSFHHLGLGLSNATQFPNVNFDQDVTPKARESQVADLDRQ
jgi:hypothetical protein